MSLQNNGFSGLMAAMIQYGSADNTVCNRTVGTWQEDWGREGKLQDGVMPWDMYIEYEQYLAEIVKQTLRRLNYPYEFHDELGIFLFCRRCGKVLLNNKIIIDHYDVGISVELSAHKPPEGGLSHGFEIWNLTNLMNNRVKWGKFHCDVREGVIRFRGFLPSSVFQDHSMIRRLISSGNSAYRHFYPAIAEVLFGKMKAEAALDKLEREKKEE